MTQPTISALTITRDRPERLKRAVDMFLAQTYPDKFMVIVVDPRGQNTWTDEFRRWVDGHPDVEITLGVGCESVSDLRNLSVEMGLGEFVMTWDDDDYYHPTRMEEQYKALTEQHKDASLLVDCVTWFEDTGQMFLDAYELGVSASLMARRVEMPKYQATHETSELGSDFPVQMAFMREGRHALVEKKPWLYVRTWHGGNMWDRRRVLQSSIRSSFLASRIESERATIVPKLREFFLHAIPNTVQDRTGKEVTLW